MKQQDQAFNEACNKLFVIDCIRVAQLIACAVDEPQRPLHKANRTHERQPAPLNDHLSTFSNKIFNFITFSTL
jgi:hypothetical protein